MLNKIASGLRQRIPVLAEMETHQTGRAVREMKAQLARLPEWWDYLLLSTVLIICCQV